MLRESCSTQFACSSSTKVQILTQRTLRSNDEAAQRAKALESNAFSIVEKTLNALQESERARKAAGVLAEREREELLSLCEKGREELKKARGEKEACERERDAAVRASEEMMNELIAKRERTLRGIYKYIICMYM